MLPLLRHPYSSIRTLQSALRALCLLALALALVFILGGCAARPGPELLVPVPAAAASARQVTIYVATSRQPDAAHSQSFCSSRAQELHFARYVMSIPPNHKPASIEWQPKGPVDPARSFATVDFAALSQQAFLDRLAAGPALPDPLPTNQEAPTEPAPLHGEDAGQAHLTTAQPVQPQPIQPQPLLEPASQELAPPGQASQVQAFQAQGNRIGIFVHGYNTSFPEALLRITQLMADSPLPAKALLFSWPSDGMLSGYVADKEAATYSRDHLARLLTLLTEDSRLGDVNLAAHSMGAWLAMESLRQLRLSGQDRVIDRLGSVILAAPDIDLDVFRSQVQTIGPLSPPLTVLASPDDRALLLSNRLGGDRERAGSLDARDPSVQDLARNGGVQLIDISGTSATDSLNHDRFVGAAASLQKLLTPRETQNPLRKAGAFVLDAAASVLEVPGRLTRAVAENVQ